MEILFIILDWLHWIIFGVGCLASLIMIYALFVAKYDEKDRSKGEGM